MLFIEKHVKVKGPVKSRVKTNRKPFYISLRDEKIKRLGKNKGVEWFATQEAAQARADEINNAQRTGGVVVKHQAGTVAAAIELYCAWVQSRVDDKKITYQHGLNCKTNASDFAAKIGSIPCSELTVDQCQTAVESFDLSHKTKKEKLTALKQVLDMAIRQSWCVGNMARSVKLEVARYAITEDEVFDGEVKRIDMADVKAVMDVALAYDGRNRNPGSAFSDGWCYGLAVAFAFQTGLRFGEQAALRWRSIKLDRGRVEVSTAMRLTDCNMTAIGLPKTSKARRVVKIGKTLVALLRAWKLRSNYSSDDELVFPNPTGTMEKKSDKWRRNVLHRACDVAGVERFSWHHMRHVYASVLLDQFGDNWLKIADRMGHENANFTRKQYGHWIDKIEDEDEESDLMDAAYA